LRDGGRISLRTDSLPSAGVYRVSFQVRSRQGRRPAVQWSVVVGDQRFRLETDSTEWEWTEPIEMTFEAGVNPVDIRSRGPSALELEAMRIERVCPGLCSGDKVKGCLDARFNRRSGLSQFVVEVSGRAGHAQSEADTCGADGYYTVAGGNTRRPGRLVAEVEVPVAGRYLFRFQYRIGSAKQRHESIQVAVGDRVFEFQDQELRNTNAFEWSPLLEVALGAGRQTIELQSVGADSVHLERIQLERVCECGTP
jgi:hypothetical protein